MNVEQIVALPLLETFTVDGTAVSIPAAHSQAWLTLENALIGTDFQWKLKGMTMLGDPATGKVTFKAEFIRAPDEDD